MKITRYIFTLLIGAFIGCLATYKIMSKSDSSKGVVINSTSILHQIEQLGNLEVAKYNIQTMLEYTKNRNILLPNGKTILQAHGEIIACIDFSKIQMESIKIEKDSISIILPNPEICQVIINHEKSKLYDINFGLWETAEMVDETYKYAEIELKKSAQNINLNNEAKTNASTLMKAFLQSLGFKKVNIQYEIKNTIRD